MKAWQLLKSPNRLCRKSFARTVDGNSTAAHSPTAYSWCTVGALMYCYSGHLFHDALEKLANHLDTDIILWSDTSSYKTVHATLKQLDL